MGSDPLPAARQQLKSSDARSTALVLATAIANAKFGAWLCVARNREIADNQRNGRSTNACGEKYQHGKPLNSGCNRPSTNPESWKYGSQVTVRQSGPYGDARAIAAELTIR